MLLNRRWKKSICNLSQFIENWTLNVDVHVEYSPQSSYFEKCLTRKTLSKTDVMLFLDYIWLFQDYGHIIIFVTDVFASCCCLYCALVLRYLRYIINYQKKKNLLIVYTFFLEWSEIYRMQLSNESNYVINQLCTHAC